MTWTAFRVSLRLLSPIHIGWRKIGNLQQTRPYVTGRNLWGALTARLTRELSSYNYEDIGKQVDDQLAFTYFYPATKESKDKLFTGLNNGLSWPWGNQEDEFAWTFLGSYSSTALEEGRSSEAGSLHETEFIAPYTRSKEQTYLIGYIFARDGNTLNWQSALHKLQLGGERSYGWGRVKYMECENYNDTKCFGYDFLSTENHPKVIVPAEKVLLAHTIATSDTNIVGTIEPLTGRETTGSSGFGGSFSEVKICWVPGGKVLENKTCQILAKGLWELI